MTRAEREVQRQQQLRERSQAAQRVIAERLRRYRERRKAVIPESKSETPAPSPPGPPAAQRELSEVEKAMQFTFSPLRGKGTP